jgi:hypothetical protein
VAVFGRWIGETKYGGWATISLTISQPDIWKAAMCHSLIHTVNIEGGKINELLVLPNGIFHKTAKMATTRISNFYSRYLKDQMIRELY